MPAPGGCLPCPFKKKSTPARRLMAALNKLSARNYCKVTRDIADIMSEPAASDALDAGEGGEEGEVGDAEEAVDAVLGKSATDGCYTEVYARMLLDVLAELAGGGGKPAKAAVARRHLVAHVRACVPQDGSSLAESALALSRIPAGSAAEYDNLCAAVKAKKQFLGRVSTALAVVALDSQRGADDDDMPGTGCAADSVCGAFETTVAEYAASLPPPSDASASASSAASSASASAATTTAIEVMLEVVKLLVRACPSAKPSALARVGVALTPRLMATFGSKCRFLATDVLGVDAHAPQQPRQKQQGQQQQQQGRPAAGPRVVQRQREPAAGGPQRRPQQGQGQGQGPGQGQGHQGGQQQQNGDTRGDKAAGGWHSRRG